ncbi:hypothetical protein HG536_0H01070 [Torulaspora globosa]|uniref:30 kDa heat shock protein n=1 Tax=Torulaspora globosa TaxID=48254 RepID=A0A7G3ZMJ6_9SACH|nr:uncharacterized protein HG536_0H01070 [Torulaspora globosa]QLL34732.1 hypothetical protein HG536_0H01070 [Torulaspora globosa]
MVEFLLKGGNQAVSVNPPHDLDFHITKQGSSWLWAVTSVFGLLVVVYAILFFIAEMRSTSLVRYSLAAPLLVSLFMCFFYFTYASNLGWTGIQAEFGHVKVNTPVTGLNPGVRQIFYSRFVAWFLSWPLLLFLIELSSVSTAEQHGETFSVFDMIHSLLVQIFSAYFWIVALLVGALIRSTYKWGYFTFAAVSMLIMEAMLIRRQFVTLKTRAFNAAMLGFILVVVWLYFICWGLSEGGNRIQPDSEAVFYGILDLIVFAVYPAYLLFIIKAFGDWPAFSWKGGFARRVDEEHAEKPSGQTSVRQSGETAVPQTHVNHPAAAAATGPALAPTAEHPNVAAGHATTAHQTTTTAEIPAAIPVTRETA